MVLGKMTDFIENPIQTTALYKILVMLNKHELLENDPLTVIIEREEYAPVYPCSKGKQELDMNQVKWANENGKFWFLGHIKKLCIRLKENSLPHQLLTVICQSADERAEEAGFSIEWVALS